ncbi:unnamed protein product [Nesidiocoris tenuis]|uniref:Reverse transcriptase Ty1/copia-type domain-containing protein n=1 Tax=Nesidiocoris tenuis TaxID=355587 RepID=A0A6H5H6H4_9HEMI|nr:unnamed protein product [Nesidiocoris tenuis]
MQLRDRNLIILPERFKDYVMMADHQKPQTYREAMQTGEAAQWKAAMDDEIKSLIQMDTWELVDLPPGKKLVDCRWVFKVKIKANGEFDKFKARVVAKGFSQIPGIDYKEVFSPVVRYDTIRTLLSAAASEGLELMQFDVKTAFLNGELDEEIFMKQPDGFNNGTKRVCKLKRSIYGLKQAPRCRNIKFTNSIKSQGLIPSQADPCLYHSQNKKEKLFLAIYVDDGILCGSNLQEMKKFMNNLKEAFTITE